MNLFYRTTTRLVRQGLRWVFRCQVIGLENVPSGGVLLAANHLSFYDPPFLCAIVAHRDVTWLAKRELFDIPLLGRIMRHIRTIPLNQAGPDVRAMREALRRLEAGEVVGIMPEGGRSLPGRERPAQPGVALLAHRAGVPVVPVGVSGTNPLVRMVGFRPVPSRVWFRFGTPLAPPGETRLNDCQRRAYTSLVMQAVADLVRRNQEEDRKLGSVPI